MLINKDTAISTSRVLLVPYEAHHVPTYHEWMKDEEIQALTASEPLSLPAEYSMQASWRHDADKLTFIICTPLPTTTAPATASTIHAHQADAPTNLLGDVNLFLTPSEDADSKTCTGELELMIASPSQRRHGYGRAALLAFLRYISAHQSAILHEYAAAAQSSRTAAADPKPAAAPEELQLRVKIGSANAQSIALFESLGFVRLTESPNYFGELELALEGGLGEERVGALCDRFGVAGYRECAYVRDDEDGSGGAS